MLLQRRFCSCLRIIVATWAIAVLAQGEEPQNAVTPTLGQLLAMRPEELAGVDLIEEYQLCASGLPGVQVDKSCRENFNLWAAEIRSHPPEGDAKQKAQALADVLRRALRSNSIPVSVQVAYVALGRQLGYPLKLGSQNGEPCVFWADETTNFEVQGLRRSELFWGLSNPEVEHPFQSIAISFPQKDGAGKEWILGPRDELSIFLGLRALRLEEAGLNDEALVAFSQAHQLSPSCLDHLNGILRVAKKITPLVGQTGPVQIPEKRESPFDEVNRINRLNALDSEISQLRAEKSRLMSEQARKKNNRP